MHFGIRHSVDANTRVSLTDEGKHDIDEDMVRDLRAYTVLAELDKHSPQSLSSIARTTGMNVMAVKTTVDRLRRQNMVRVIEGIE